MEKQIQIALILFLLAFAAMSQTPALFKYQSVVRDGTGAIIANQEVSFEISILTGSANGNAVYTEEHFITTNANGLANMTIGNGSITSGSSISNIDWGAQLHFMQISIDTDGGNNFVVLGTSQLLSVPYAMHARTVEIDNVNDADSDVTNEIQDLELDGSSLKITNNATATSIDLSQFEGNNTDEQTLDLQGNTLAISNGNDVDLSSVQDGFEANTDEQNLSLSGTDLSISGGNTIDVSGLQDGVDDADSDATNEIQDLELDGSSLKITNNANATTIDLSQFQGNNTDEQDLSLTGTDLSISGGNTIDVSSLQDGVDDADADATNEIQDLSLVGSTLTITNNEEATEINLAPFQGTNTDEQTLSLTGTVLAVTNGNNVDLAAIQDGFEANTDEQDLSLTGTDLSISGGNTIDVSSLQDGVDDADADPNNEIQDISLTGTDLSISDGSTVDLSAIQDGFEANTDAQNLSLSGNTLSLTNDASNVDLSGYLDNTDDQTLSFNGTNLTIQDGNSVNISALGSLTLPVQTVSSATTVDNTSRMVRMTAQVELTLPAAPMAGQILHVIGGNAGSTINPNGRNFKDGPNFLGSGTLSFSDMAGGSGAVVIVFDGFNWNFVSKSGSTSAESQELSLTGTNLSISDGNTVNLASIQDGVNDADADATNEIQDLNLSGSTLTITNNAGATEIDLSPFAGTNTDEQTLSLSGTDLSVSNGNTIDVSSLQDGFEANTDEQDLSLTGTDLSISGGNTIDVSGLQDGFEANTDNQGVDAFSLSGTTLSLSLDNDGEANQTVNLSSLQDGFEANTDDQTIDALSLSGTTLSISLEGDNEAAQTVSLASLQDGTGTDNQGIETFSLSGTTLSLALDNDGQANQTVDLSSLSGGGTFSTVSNLTTNTGGTYATDDFLFGSFRLADGFDADYDNRVFFDKSKGAFRAGGTPGDEWNDGNVGANSTATGWGSEASGDYSTAMGQFVTAQSYNSIVLGRYNESIAGTADSWVATDELFVLANGTGSAPSNRSNALTVLKNGNIGVGVTDPDSELEIEGQIKITGGSPGTDKVLVSDADGLASWTFRRRVFETNSNVTSNSEGTYGLDDFVFGASQLADDDDPNHSKRFFFDKSKGAFRAGSVSNDSWDDINVGLNSTAFGYHTIASGTSSIAMGHDNTASANYSTALGNESTASQSYATAMGYQSTASGQYATAMGRQTTASESYATAIGNNTEASGTSSTAMGNYTTASATQSTAMGNATTASNTAATAMGANSTASGNTSTAMGQGTTASGTASTSMGGSTEASGGNSVAMGQQTTAQAYSSLVLGRYNVISGNSSTWVSTDPLFVLGNGGSLGAPSNALTVLKNGNMGIGVVDPDVELEVDGTVKISDMLTLTPQASPPSAGSMGDVYMDTDGKLYVHNGTIWRALAFE